MKESFFSLLVKLCAVYQKKPYSLKKEQMHRLLFNVAEHHCAIGFFMFANQKQTDA